MRFPSATHLVAVFQDREDAERFRREVEERLAVFGLQVAPEKTAVLLFDGNLLKGNRRPATGHREIMEVVDVGTAGLR